VALGFFFNFAYFYFVRWRGRGQLIRTRIALLFCTSDTSVRPVVRRTRDGPICRDNEAPTALSISLPDPLSHGPGNETPTIGASPACRNARTRVHLRTKKIAKAKYMYFVFFLFLIPSAQFKSIFHFIFFRYTFGRFRILLLPAYGKV